MNGVNDTTGKSSWSTCFISGFVRVTMQMALSRVSAAVQHLAHRSDKPLFVFLIDGKPSSGKSTMAKSLSRLIPNSSVLDADAFLKPRVWRERQMNQFLKAQLDLDELVVPPDFHTSFWDWASLCDFIAGAHHAAESMSEGGTSLQFIHNAYNRATGERDGHARVNIRRGGILLVPGCYLLGQLAPSVFQSSMMMTVTCDEGLRRKLMREDAKPNLPDASRFGTVAWSWINIEEPTFETHMVNNCSKTQVILDNSNWARPSIRKFSFNIDTDDNLQEPHWTPKRQPIERESVTKASFLGS